MKIDRLMGIILVLLEKERVGAQALSTLFEVSPRTIYRDIDALNLAGIPVRSLPGVGGGFEIMRQYKLDRKVFSAADLSSILMGLSSLSHILRGEELANALAKIRSLIPADSAKDVEHKANQISVDVRPWMDDRSLQPNLEVVKTALQQNRLLTFTYVDGHSRQTTRTAEPYQLILKDNHWYWQGFCLTRNDFRLFKLSRTLNLQMQETVFTPRDHPKPQLDFTDLWTNLQTPVTLRIHPSILDRVLDVCTDESISPDGDEHYIVRFPLIENDYYYDMLLGFGAECEVLAPLRVRAEVRCRIQALAALYANDGITSDDVP